MLDTPISMESFQVLTIATLLFLVNLTAYLIEIKTKSRDSRMANFITASGIALMINSVVTLDDFAITSFANMLNFEVPEMGTTWPTLALGIALVIFGFAWRKVLTDRIYVFNMLGHTQREISNTEAVKELGIADFKLKEQVVNINPMLQFGEMNEIKCEIICGYLELEAAKFINRTEGRNSCFTGMASIPFTVFVGTLMADGRINRYFEFNRHNGERFYRLKRPQPWHFKKFQKWKGLNISYSDCINDDVTEVVLAVSVSTPILDVDLEQFEGLDVVRIDLEGLKDNAITHMAQLQEYKRQINDCLGGGLKEKYPKLQLVHLVAAIPSCLSVEIGKSIGMGTNRFANIVVYHYTATSTPRYKFGVCVNGDRKGSLIQPGR